MRKLWKTLIILIVLVGTTAANCFILREAMPTWSCTSGEASWASAAIL